MVLIALILGGSGKVARHMTRILASEGNTVYSMIRKESQVSSIFALGSTPILQSIEDSSVSDLASIIRRVEATVIIWAAGAGSGNPLRTKAIDEEGAIKSMDATALAGVKRFIMVSAVDVRDRVTKPVPEWYSQDDKLKSDRTWKTLHAYMACKFAADKSLVTENARRNLEYTIVRPGQLLDVPSTGLVDAGKVHFTAGISREDVAKIVVECIHNEGTKGLAIDFMGGTTKIKEAVAGVAEARVDCFEGRY